MGEPAGSTAAAPSSPVRADIQVLRGVAVLAVLLYHSGLGLAASGYLGVDIFFVISGFLITGIVSREIEAGRFSFPRFYERRIRRLMPAGLAVLAATTLAAMTIATSRQYGDYYPNLLGSLAFVGNLTLWGQSGYFHPDSEFQPLLHMWSLAIEEQYYLLMPAFLFLLPRRWWRTGIAAVLLASLAIAIWLWPSRPGIAFFWLPPRAWELGVGSLAALVANQPEVRRWAAALFWPAIAMVVASIFIVLPGPKPGLGAIVACLATATVILAARDGWERPSLRPIAWAGDISYSLYLVHWPIFAFVRMSRMDATLPIGLSCLLMLVSVGLAAALYYGVEQPARRSTMRGAKLFAAWLIASLAIAALATAHLRSLPYGEARRQLDDPVRGLDAPGCFDEHGGGFSDQCRQPGKVRMMLWGDSYSSHLVPGLIATTPVPFMQATRPHCSTFIDYGGYDGPNERALAEGCIRYFRDAADYVAGHPEIEVVIIAGMQMRAIPPSGTDAIRWNGKTFEAAPRSFDETVAAMRRTVDRLRQSGKRVVIVMAAPPSDIDLGECWLRQSEHRLSAEAARRCALRLDSPASVRFRYPQLLRAFEGIAPVIRLDEVICPKGLACRTEADGLPLFRDSGHFTPAGSLWVGTQARLGQRAWAEAR